MGTLLHSCVEVRKAIKLSFGVVSGVGPSTDVLDGGPRAPRGRCYFWDFSAFAPHWLKWAEWRIFRTEMYLTVTDGKAAMQVSMVHRHSMITSMFAY